MSEMVHFDLDEDGRGLLCRLDGMLEENIGESMSSLGFYLDGDVVKWKTPQPPVKSNMKILDEAGEEVEFENDFPQRQKVEFSFTVDYKWLAKRYENRQYKQPIIMLINDMLDSHFLGE